MATHDVRELSEMLAAKAMAEVRGACVEASEEELREVIWKGLMSLVGETESWRCEYLMSLWKIELTDKKTRMRINLKLPR